MNVDTMSDVIDDLQAWCRFDISPPPGSPPSPLARRTRRAVELLHRVAPASLEEIKNRYVDLRVPLSQEAEAAYKDAGDEQVLFLEEITQAYKEATAKRVDELRASLTPPRARSDSFALQGYGIGATEDPERTRVPFSTMPEPDQEREDPPSPTPARIYPSLPIVSGTRQASTSITSSAGLPAPALLTSVDAALTSQSVAGSTSSMSEALGRLSLVSRLGRRLTGRQRQSTASESTSATGSSNRTYSSASDQLSSATLSGRLLPSPEHIPFAQVRDSASQEYRIADARTREQHLS